MKIGILVAKDGYSFVNQAYGLVKGLKLLNNQVTMIKVNSDNSNLSEFKNFQPNWVISIGPWSEYKTLVENPISMGLKVVPWIVSDDKITNFQAEFNKLPLILTTSQYCKTIFTQDGIDPKIVKVLPEAVDPEFWQIMPEDQLKQFTDLISISDSNISLPFHFDLSQAKQHDIPILFTTGGDVTSKGAQEVITALGIFKQKYPDFKWIYILKTWPSTTSFEKSIEELNLAKNSNILSHIRYITGEFSQNFILGLMNTCDIYIAPSKTEGFGLPLVEAQLCQKPVITINATASGETIVEGKTGFIAKTDTSFPTLKADPQDLFLYIEKLLLDKSLRENMGRQAREVAISRFSPKIIAQSLIEIISISSNDKK